MDSVVRKPYQLIWLTIPALVLIGLIFRTHTVDIQLADTYYVISNLYCVLPGSVFMLVLGMAYWLMRRQRLNPTLTALHILLTIGPLVLIVLPLPTDNQIPSNYLIWGVAGFILGQCLFLINSTIALVRSITL